MAEERMDDDDELGEAPDHSPDLPDEVEAPRTDVVVDDPGLDRDPLAKR